MPTISLNKNIKYNASYNYIFSEKSKSRKSVTDATDNKLVDTVFMCYN